MPVLKGRLQPEGAVVDVQVSWSARQARQLRQAFRPVPPALDGRALVDTGQKSPVSMDPWSSSWGSPWPSWRSRTFRRSAA